MKISIKKIIVICLILIPILVLLIYNIEGNATTQIKGINKFPDSYKPYLIELSKKHPNWNFTALYTNLDWNYVVSQENIFGKNLVPKNYKDTWKNTTPGQYDVEVDGGWVDSSKQAVEYCLDPRNFLNEVRIFQFEELSYNSKTNNLDSIEKILYGTEFYQRKVSYLDSNGNTISMGEKYSDLILKAGRTSYVSSYHLASRIKQEVGPFLSHSSISGNVEGYKGLYNFYNIGATSSPNQMEAIKKGLQYAKDGNGASQSTKDKYLIPWNNKDKSITGGAIFIGSSYINIGQNTIYLQKFHVYDNKNDELFWHQYMTNVLAPYSESRSIYNGYQKTGILDTTINFVIPIYNNMPEIPTQSPDIENKDFIQDSTNVTTNTSGNVNIRTGPSTSYEIITTVTNTDKMTRIKKGISNGERWDMVKLENGIIGYIYQNYVKEIEDMPDIEDDFVESDEEINISFEDTIRVDGREISGIKYNENTVKHLKDKISTDLEVEIVNNKNEVLEETDIVGTNSKILIKRDGKILRKYTIIIYGDSNGDGKINSVDLLVLQRHILEIQKIDEIYQKACNIRKNGKKPTSVDLLLIQRHILKLQIIEQ